MRGFFSDQVASDRRIVKNHDNTRGCGSGYKNKSKKRMKSRKTGVKARV
jgi:hypothetical protein